MPLLEEMLVQAQRSGDLGSSGTLAPACSHVATAVVRAFTSLLEAFGELIRDTCASMHGSAGGGGQGIGVDLSREKRANKCKICREVLMNVRKRIPAIKEQLARDEATVRTLADFQEALIKAI